jgi:putative ABC transport system permease protein
MDKRRSVNRAMFWRVIRRSIFANRGRLFVILLALGAGAAITAALLNLQVDAKHRITTEFRSFGANVLIAPRESSVDQERTTLPEQMLEQLPVQANGQTLSATGLLYTIGDATAYSDQSKKAKKLWSGVVVIAGYRLVGEDLARSIPYTMIEHQNVAKVDAETCEIGKGVADQTRIHTTGTFELQTQKARASCVVSEIRNFGSAEDNQILVSLGMAQHLLGLTKRVSLIQLTVPGTPAEVQAYLTVLQQKFPDADVRPIRQFAEGEARLYTRISGILTATVAVVLILTALSVMAAMTNVAMERKNDVGLMKSIGGSVRRVLRLFLAEAALLGLTGGLIGAAVGIVISIGLGKAVFGVAARPRLIVYPISVALTIIVAILAAYPLRRLVHIRPASVFRGEQ